MLLGQIDRVEAFKLQVTKFHSDLNAVITTSPIVSKTLENMSYLERDFDKLASQLRNIRCKIQDEEEVLNKQIQGLNSNVEHLKAELEDTTSTLTKMGERAQTLEYKVKTLNEASQSNQNHDSNILLQNLRQELAEMSSKVDDLENLSRKLRNEIDAKDHQLYEKTMNIAALNEELEQLLTKADEDTQDRVRESIKRTQLDDSDEDDVNLPEENHQFAGLKKQQLINMNLRMRNEIILLKENVGGYQEDISQLKLELGRLKSEIEGVGIDRTSMGRQSFGIDANILNMRNSDMLAMFKKINEEVSKPIDESELTAPDSTPEKEQPILTSPLPVHERIIEITNEVRMDQAEKDEYESTIKQLKEEINAIKEKTPNTEIREIVREVPVEVEIHLSEEEQAEYIKIIENLKEQLEVAKKELQRHIEHANQYPESIKQDPVEALKRSKLALEESQLAQSKVIIDPTQSIIQTEESSALSFGKPVDPLYESQISFARKTIEEEQPKAGLSTLTTSTIMQDSSTNERMERLQSRLSSLAESKIEPKSKVERNPQELSLRKMNKEFSILQIRIKDIQKKLSANDTILLKERAEFERAQEAKVEQKVIEDVEKRLLDLTAEQKKLQLELAGCQDIESQLMKGISSVLADITKSAGGDPMPEKLEETLQQSKIIVEQKEIIENSIKEAQESIHSPGAAVGHIDHSKLEVPHTQTSQLTESQASTANFGSFNPNASFPQHVHAPVKTPTSTTSTIQATDRQVIRIKKKQNMTEQLSRLLFTIENMKLEKPVVKDGSKTAAKPVALTLASNEQIDSLKKEAQQLYVLI